MMDVGGKVPGSQVSDALSIWEEGIRIPPIKIFDKGVLNETALDVILNNTRTPDTNRSDLMAIIGGCRAAERRIIEICERFGPETFEVACDALLERTRRAMAHIIRTYIPEEPQTFTDWVDDDGCGNGPFKMVLTIWREGDVCHADWTGTADQAPGSINFHIHEGLCKLFLGIYMIMAFDPEILFNDGLYDVFEVTLPEGSLLNPKFPAPLSNRLNVHTRLFDCMSGALGQKAPELSMAAGYGTSPFFVFSGYDADGEYFQFVELLFGGLPARYKADGLDGHSWWPLFRTTPAEYAESYYPVRISSYVPARDTGGAGFHRGGTGIEKTYVFTGPGSFTVNDDRATIPPWGINGGRHGGCSTKTLIRAAGEVVELVSKIDQVPVNAGDMLVFRTAGAGGWGDPLERDPQLVLRDVLRDLVSHEVALARLRRRHRREHRRRGCHRGRARAAQGRARAHPALRLRPRPDRRIRMTTSLRSRLSEPGAIVALGAHDGLTARIAERAGIEALYHGGYATAAHHFGLPDVGLIGRAEVVESVRRMRGATDLPIVVDADTGYGSEAGVWLTVRELEAVGANAVQIEDQVSPKRCGHMEGKEVIPADEMVIKVRAAVAARRSDETLIIARSDALQVTGLEDTLARCNAYSEAGADLVFVDAPRTVEEYAAITESCSAPCVANMSETGRSPVDLDRRARGDGLQARHLPEHADVALRQGLRGALPGGPARQDDGGPRRSLHELRRRQRVARARRVAIAMSARDVYDARGFGGRQGAGRRPAVVVVDFIEGFTNPASALACDADAAVGATRQLLDAARAAGVPVIFTTVCYADDDLERAAMFIAKAPALATLRPGSPWVEVDARLAPRAEEPVLVKLFASAFFGTPLDEMLREAGCDTVLVTGASTSGCVRATAVDALQYGYRVLVPREGVADRAIDAHNGSLLDIDAKYGDVISIDEAIAAVAAAVPSPRRAGRERRPRHDRRVQRRARRLRRGCLGRDG